MNDYFRHSKFGGYAVAVLSVVLALLARMQLDPVLGGHYAHVTFYLAVVITTATGGWQPGVAALVLGALGAEYLFDLRHSQLPTAKTAHLIGTGAYFIVGGAIISFSEAQRAAQGRAQKRLTAFARLGEHLSSVMKPLEAGRIIGDAAGELLGWDAFSLSLYSLEDNRVDPILNIESFEGGKMEILPSHQFSGVPPLVRHVMKNGGELVLNHEIPARSPPGPRLDAPRAPRSMMLVPVRSQTTTIGVLSIQSRESQTYQPEDLAALQALADYCGGALQRIRAEEALRQREEEIRQLNLRLEHRVEERTAQLASSNRELEAFCHSVSHDLRRPLRSISGFAQALNQDYADRLDGAGREFLQYVIDSSREMDTLINDLLHLSRLAQADMKCQPVDLSALAEEIARELRRMEPGRRVEFAIAPGLTASCDGRLMRIALENLLNNAWKFTGKRPAARIEFGREERPEGRAYFVRDDGAGFDTACAGKLFEVFQRLHSSEEFSGHGVGLATVQRIIHRHGGRIWAAGEVDQGAVFRFTLPS